MRHSNWRHIFKPKDLGIILLLAILMAVLEYTGILAGPEGWLEDRWLRLAGSHLPSVSGSVVILDIDDATHRDCFDPTPPMNASTVSGLVKQIVQLEPTVVGIDILTDDPKYAGAYRNLANELKGFQTKTVWIAGVDRKFHATVPNLFGWFAGEPTELVIKPTRVLGFDPGELEDRQDVQWGPAVYATEEDHKLRRFPRELGISADPESSGLSVNRETWARKIGDRFCERNPCPSVPNRSEVFLPVGTRTVSYSVLDFFSCSKSALPREFGISEGKRDVLKQLTAGKIVLLGGTFASSGDFYETPGGRDSGIVVNARAVEAEISGSGLGEVKPYVSFGLDLVTGAMMLMAFFVLEELLKQNRVLVTVSGSLFAVALLWSAVYLFLGKNYMFSFASLIFGVLIHQLIDLWNGDLWKSEKEPKHKPARRRAAHRG